MNAIRRRLRRWWDRSGEGAPVGLLALVIAINGATLSLLAKWFPSAPTLVLSAFNMVVLLVLLELARDFCELPGPAKQLKSLRRTRKRATRRWRRAITAVRRSR